MSKKTYWTEPSIKREALKYNTRTEFKDAAGGAYFAAHRLGILDEVCEHMPHKSHRYKWSPESVRAKALEFSTVGEFKTQAPGALVAAKRLGIAQEVCAHMTSSMGRPVAWTREKINDEASHYSSLGEFRRGSLRAYAAASRMGILNELYQHVLPGRAKTTQPTKTPVRPKMNTHWSFLMLFDEAAKYHRTSEFKRHSRKAYSAARRRNLLPQLCAHMINDIGRPEVWTLQAIVHEARRYSSRSEFRRESKKAHDAAMRKGILDEVCEHMTPRRLWTPETIADEARRYSSRSEFARGSSGAYAAATNMGILDEVCQHMVRRRRTSKRAS